MKIENYISFKAKSVDQTSVESIIKMNMKGFLIDSQRKTIKDLSKKIFG
jgi:hypothetical protein